MLLKILIDIAKLGLLGGLAWLLLHGFARWKRPRLADALGRHRLFTALILGAVIIGIDVSEDALTGDSGPVDKSILLFLHRNVPASFNGFFETVTLTGSFNCLIALLAIAVLVFLLLKKWFEAFLLVGSGICGALTIYLLKSVTGRERPALWETRWYWGTSFPSGHTLETACFATALTLCLSRLWPHQARWIRMAASAWVILVGFSRMVLGVHWPTDVLSAVCIGMLLAVTIQFVLMKFMAPPQPVLQSATIEPAS